MREVGEAAAVVAATLVGYLVGSFPTAVLVARRATRGRVDIRQAGSGNPGAFNTLREVGVVWGVVVVLGDGAKGVVAPALGWLLAGDAGALAAATTVIAGHIAPVWLGFRGGKGVATAGGALLGVFPAFFPIDVAVLALGALVTRRSAWAAWAGMVAWAVASVTWTVLDWPNLWGPDPGAGLVAFSVAGAAMVSARFRRPANPTAAS